MCMDGRGYLLGRKIFGPRDYSNMATSFCPMEKTPAAFWQQAPSRCNRVIWKLVCGRFNHNLCQHPAETQPRTNTSSKFNFHTSSRSNTAFTRWYGVTTELVSA